MRLRWFFALGTLVACAEHFPRSFDDPPATQDAGPDGAPPTDAGPDSAVVDGAADADASLPCLDVDGATPALAFEPIVTSLTAPVESVAHDGNLYVLEQGGRVLRIDPTNAMTVMLDVSSIIVSGGEAGLLGIAFHPKFATNGYVYLYYTIPTVQQPPPDGIVFESLLVRYHSTDNGLTLDPESAHPILQVDQPFSNHNGGTIAFGNDGFLYWGLGDGGSGGDPFCNGQNTNVLLAKMLRIDVDEKDPYGIPASNPFASSGGKPEIFAYGLRNPYRWRFDRPTGDLLVGDVGQGAREEIDKLTLGGNYGWSFREGKIAYPSPACDAGAAAGPFIDPIVDHTRDEAVTIIGGVIYRGTKLPLLTGKYVYGDFGLQKYYAFDPTEPAPVPELVIHGHDGISPSSFTLDNDGEIVVTDYNGGLYRVVAPRVCE
jgi:glucose/arabinose dehydrogenase